MLNDTRVRTAKRADRPIKLSNSGGLHLLIQPNGSKLWRLAYRFGGKQKTLANCRIGKVEQPTLLGESYLSASLPLELHQQLFRNCPEGIATSCRQFFEPALRRRIDIIGEQSFGFVALLTRVLQGNGWIDADGERLLFPPNL